MPGLNTLLKIGRQPRMPQLKSWYAARDAGMADAIIIALGDSLTAGANGAKANSYPSRLAARMKRARGSAASFFGDNNMTSVGGGMAAYDARLTIGNAWAISADFTTLGAKYWLSDGAGAVFGFNPGSEVFDTIDVYGGRYSGGPSLPLTYDALVAASPANIVLNNASGDVSKQAFTVPMGTHTLQMGGLSAGGYIAGMILRKSDEKRVHVVNGGHYGATTAMLALSATYETLDVLKVVRPNLTTIMAGTNDKEAAVADATYRANLTTMVTAAKLTGDALLVTPPYGPTATYGTEASQLAYYMDNMKQVAAATGAGFFNLMHRPGWTSHAIATARGFMDADTIHLTAAGYEDIATALLPIIDA